MEASSGNHCVRPFNHLPFLVASGFGGLIAFLIAIALTQSNYWGKGILLGLLVGAFYGMYRGYRAHIKFYNKHNSEYHYKPSKHDIRLALGPQIFISVCWAIFSILVIAWIDQDLHLAAKKGEDFFNSLPELSAKRPSL